jgi:hydrocephalus-inducing protein
VLFSQIGGEYVFPLHATCLAPKPQGPYQVKANGTTSIAFKNVFSQPLAFSFAIDNQLFSVNKTTEVIKAHQTYKIVVGFDGNDSTSGSKADVMAKLVVTAAKSAGTSNHVQWVYYLRGTS